jgi:hypothetical protein
MIPKRQTPDAVGKRGTVKREDASFFWPGMALIVALCAFIQFLAGILDGVYGVRWGAAAVVFFFANFTLAVMIPKAEILPAIDGEGTLRRIRPQDCWFVSYLVIIGLGFNWVCAFLWFSRRFAFFSIRVIAVTGLIMALYAAIALLVARLTGGNWRRALLIFVFAPVVLAGGVLRLGLLR